MFTWWLLGNNAGTRYKIYLSEEHLRWLAPSHWPILKFSLTPNSLLSCKFTNRWICVVKAYMMWQLSKSPAPNIHKLGITFNMCLSKYNLHPNQTVNVLNYIPIKNQCLIVFISIWNYFIMAPLPQKELLNHH